MFTHHSLTDSDTLLYKITLAKETPGNPIAVWVHNVVDGTSGIILSTISVAKRKCLAKIRAVENLKQGEGIQLDEIPSSVKVAHLV